MNNRTIIGAVCMIGLAGLLWFFPLIRIVPLNDHHSEQPKSFDAAATALQIWDGQLEAAGDNAPQFTEVASALQKDFKAGKNRYGKGDSISDNCVTMAQLVGKVSSENGKNIVFSVEESQLSVIASQRMVFGNNVRDACGFLNINDFASSEDWNALSKELNKLVESRVLPQLQTAKHYDLYRLIVCLEVPPEIDWTQPVKVVVVSMLPWRGPSEKGEPANP